MSVQDGSEPVPPSSEAGKCSPDSSATQATSLLREEAGASGAENSAAPPKRKFGVVKINILSSWMAHVVALVVGVYLMPYALHVLGDSKYGVWIFLNAIAGYSGLLYLGFGQTSCRYVATCHARKDWLGLNRVVTVVFLVYSSIGLLALGAVCIAAWFAPWLYDWGDLPVSEIRLVILLLGANCVLSLVGSVFGGVLIGVQRFEIHQGIAICTQLIRLGLTVMFLTSEWGLFTLTAIYFFVTVIEVGGELYFAYREVPELSLHPRNFDRNTLRECTSFSLYSFLNTMAQHMLSATDTVIIGAVFGATATVPYYIASRLTHFILKPIQQIARVFMPRAGELHETGRSTELQRLTLKGVGFTLMLTTGFFVGAGFFGASLIQTWVGEGYGPSGLILVMLLGAHLVATPLEVVRYILVGMGYVRFPSIVLFVEAVINVGLSLILIRLFGLYGVALATLIPVVVIELGILLPYASKKLGISSRRWIREAIAPQLLPLSCLATYCLVVVNLNVPTTGWVPILAVSAGGGVALGLGWLLVQPVMRNKARLMASVVQGTTGEQGA